MEELANKIYEFSCNEKVNEIVKYKNKANIWRIIEYGKKSYETRYSRMFRWLLDPNENHHLGNKFAKALINKDTKNFQQSSEEKVIEIFNNKETINNNQKNVAGAIAEALANIDVLYFNEDDKETITIELKMKSEDHLSPNELHQLDKYYNAVNKKYDNNKKYNNYFYYITIDGSKPKINCKSIDKWVVKSYSDIIEILTELNKYSDDWDIIKIIKDFINDMKFIVNNELSDFSDFFPDFSSSEEKILKSLNIYLTGESSKLEEEKRFYDLFIILNRKGLNWDEIKILLEIICTKIERKSQNHTENSNVQDLIRKLFKKFTGIEITKSTNAALSPEERRGKILEAIANNTGVKTIEITRGKGQGLRLFYNDNWDNEELHAYMSGDYKGEFFNDGFSIYNPKTKETIFKEKNKEFKKVDEILSSEDKLESLFEYIVKSLGENNK